MNAKHANKATIPVSAPAAYKPLLLCFNGMSDVHVRACYFYKIANA